MNPCNSSVWPKTDVMCINCRIELGSVSRDVGRGAHWVTVGLYHDVVVD